MPEKKIILLVEDDPATANLGIRYLTRAGYRPIHASSGEEAIDIVCEKKEPVDLILMDIDLGGGMDGTQAGARILELHDLPLVFLSAHTEKKIVEKTECITSYGYIVKGAGETVLYASIKMAFKLFEYKSSLRNKEKKLKESEKKYRLMHEQAGLSVSYYSPEGIVLSYNELALKNMNASLEDLVGKSVYDLFPKADADIYMERIRNAVASNVNMQYEDYLKLPNDENWYLSVFSKICDDDNEPIGIQIISTNITERKRMEISVIESQSLLNTIIDSTNDMIWSVDSENFGLMSFNRELSDYFITYEDINIAIGMKPENLMPTRGISRKWYKFYQRAINEGPYTLEYMIYAGNKILQLSFNLLKKGDKVFGISVFGKDITERRNSEDALRKSEAHYRAVIENSYDGIILLDSKCLIKKAHLRICGFTNEDFVGKIAIDYIHPDDKALILSKFQNIVMNPKSNISAEYRLQHKLGHWVWVETTAQNLLNDPNIQSIVLNTREITERKNAEKILRENEKKYRDIYDNALEGMYRTSSDGKLLHANHALAAMFGYESPDEAINSINDMANQIWTNPEERTRFTSLLEKKKSIFGYETKFKRKDGSDFWVYINTRIVYDSNGKSLYYEGFILDISDHKRIEARILESEEKLHKIFQASPNAISLMKLPDGIFIDVNKSFERILGYKKEDVIGKTVFELNIWQNFEERDRLMKIFLQDKYLKNIKVEFLSKSGEPILGIANFSSIEINNELYSILILADISEQKQAWLNWQNI